MSHDATLAELNERFGPIADPVISLQTVSLTELLKMDIPPRETLIDPLLLKQGLMMVHAPRGIGKTHFALGLAYAVATGTSFLKYNVPNATGVLYVDGEMPAGTLKERLAAITDPSIDEPPLYLLSPDFSPKIAIPDISTLAGQSQIDELITDDVELIILDNLSCLCRSGKENEAESWSLVQSWALHHRAAGRAVIFIHHSGKSGAQRGTSRREDVLDTVVSLRHPPDYDPSEGARFEVHIEKGRALYGDAASEFEAQLEVDDDGKFVWQVADLARNRPDRILELIQDGRSNAEIAKLVGCDRSTVYRRRKSAKADGLL